MIAPRSTRAWLGLVSLFLFVSTAYADGLSDKYKIAEKLGNGAFKDVYAVEGHPELAIGILARNPGAWGNRPNLLNEEKAMLDRIAAAGVPTATILEISTYNGQKAYLQKRFATANRAPDYNTKRWEVLNETSIEDCHKIEAALVRSHLVVNDAQFLIGADGHVVLNDPLNIVEAGFFGQVSSAKPVLDQIERAAHEAIDARNTKLLNGMPEAQDPVLATYFARAKVALSYGDAVGEAALKEALLHYLESGQSTDEAREVAKAIRDGSFDVEFLRPKEAPKKANAVAVFLEDTFPKLARDLVSGGVRKLHEAASAVESDVVAAARALEFLGKKNVPATVAREERTPSEPTELVRELAARNGAELEDGERARLELLARGILERGADAPSPSIGINAVIERDVDAADHPVER
jgi:hypothetical protein